MEKEKIHNTSTRKEDKESLMALHNTFRGNKDGELLITSCKEFKKLKHVHKPLYLLFPSNVCSMNIDKGVQVNQEKSKRQSIYGLFNS